MVVFDNLFQKDFTKMSDKELLEFRREQIANLFNGQAGSPANMERQALINIAENEFGRRFKKRAETISVVALIVSVVAILISIFKK